MITIPCRTCGKRYQVSEEHADRRFTCKTCGSTVAVPDDPKADEPVAAAVVPSGSPGASDQPFPGMGSLAERASSCSACSATASRLFTPEAQWHIVNWRKARSSRSTRVA